MKFHNKVISETRVIVNAHKSCSDLLNIQRLVTTLFCIAGIFGSFQSVLGKTVPITDFLASKDPSISTDTLLLSNTISLKSYDTTYINILQDTTLKNNPSAISYAPCVLGSVKDTFHFFWAEEFGNTNTLQYNQIRFTNNQIVSDPVSSLFSVVSSTSKKIYDINATKLTPSNQRVVSATCQTQQVYVIAGSKKDSITSVRQKNSIARAEMDTFFVMNWVNSTDFNLRKMRMGSSALSTENTITVSITESNQFVFNSSIAVDSLGPIFVTLTKAASSNAQKTLVYRTYNRSLQKTGSDTIHVGVSQDGQYLNYIDAPAVAYMRNRIACAFVYKDTVFLYCCQTDPSTMAITQSSVTRVVIEQGDIYLSSPSLSYNAKKMLVTWINPTDNVIRGQLLPIVPGVGVSLPSAPVTITGSQITDTSIVTLDQSSYLSVDSLLNFHSRSALDDSSNIAVCSKQNNSAIANIWTYSKVKYRSGQWLSNNIQADAGSDSVMFYPMTLDTLLFRGVISLFIKTGPSALENNQWSSWQNNSDSASINQTCRGTNLYYKIKVNLTRPSVDSTWTPILNSLSVRWNTKPRLVSLDSVWINGVRQQSSVGFNDTIDIAAEQDTLDYSVALHDADSLSDAVICSLVCASEYSVCDTVTGAHTLRARVRLIPLLLKDTIVRASIKAVDQKRWAASDSLTYLRIRRKKPLIDSVYVNGIALSATGIGRLIVGQQNSVRIKLVQPRIVPWNHLQCRYTLTNATSVTLTDSLRYAWIGDESNASMSVIITDAFGSADTAFIRFQYPQLAVDSSVSNPYFVTKQTLSRNLSFIIGNSDSTNHLSLPFNNTGNDTLRIDSIFFHGNKLRTFTLGIPQSSTTLFYDSILSGSSMQPLIVAPGQSIRCSCIVSVVNCKGDGFIYDTMTIYSNDPALPIEKIPIRIEYNDLPTIDTFVIKPYHITRSKKNKHLLKGGTKNEFPCFSSLEFTFSEPIDSASAATMVFGFSVFDSLLTKRKDTILFLQSWSKNYTKLRLKPWYQKPSVWTKKTISVPTGIFLPTDSIAVRIASRLRDTVKRAVPNYLDIHKRRQRDSLSDTTLYLRVDSVNFTLDSISPSDKHMSVSNSTPIVLTFSSPLLPGSIDLSLENNRNLIIKSRYFSRHDTLKQISFRKIDTSGNTITYYPQKQFFYGDSVWCSYRSIVMPGSDTVGAINQNQFTIDMNHNGIPMILFDSASKEDSCVWRFYVRDIALQSVSPVQSSINAGFREPIQLIFSDSIISSTVDRNKTNNRNMKVLSTYNTYQSFGFDSVVAVGKILSYYLNRRLFFSDSVFCSFSGFLTKDSTLYSIPLLNDSVFLTQKSYHWGFKVRELKLVSVNPDSGSVGANVKDPIVLHFSGPVNPLIFDTSTGETSNKSFLFTTSYSNGKSMPITSIFFSSDSASLTIVPKDAYYSFDSIFCLFRGYKTGYSYHTVVSIIPTDTIGVMGKRSWYFLTGDNGFYTYPNPYLPGNNISHRQLGGIWFKNLHSLSKRRGELKEVYIQIFSLHAHPIFRSPLISFEEGNSSKLPRWFWNTRNNLGNEIASGVYLYAIFDVTAKILIRGKIIIVR